METDIDDFRAAIFGVTAYDTVMADVLPQDAEEAARAKIFGHTLNDDGTLRCVSPSQYKSHKRCKRLWYYDKVMHLPRKPPGKGAKNGTECHSRMEKFLNTGVDVRGPLERHGHEMIAPYLPRAPFNGGDMLVEAPLLDPQLVTPGGIRISGFSDVTLPPKDGLVVVLDHKFKKKLAQYADTQEQLAAGDPQAVIYATWGLMKWPEAVRAQFTHNNHQSEGARLNLPVTITDDRATVFEKWRKLGKYIDEEMAATALKKSPEDVEAAGDTDSSACRAFGGCDFLNVCPSSPHNRFVHGLATGTLSEIPDLGSRWSKALPPTQGMYKMGLLDEMEEKAKAATSTATTAAAPSGGPGKLVALEASACALKGVYMLPGGVVGQFQGVLGERALFKNKEGTLVDIQPDDFVRDLNGDSTALGLFAPKKTGGLPPIVDKSTTPDSTPGITQAAGIVPPDAPKDTNPPAAAVVAAPAPSATVQSPAVSDTAGKSTQGTEAPKGAESPSGTKVKKAKAKVGGDQLIILVNNACPAAEDLTPYVQGMCDALAKKAGIGDVRLGGKDSGLDYGTWKAVLTIACKTNPPPPGLYVIQQTELSEPVIEALSTVGIVSYGRGK